jgi:KaiC/GvpD/RAD55 family RecA-like ATPase
VTVLIISEDLKMGHSGSRPTSEYGIESFTDGWVNLFYRYDDKKMERSRYIEIVKMKGVHHSPKAYPIHLGDNGFVVGDDQNGSGQPDGKPSKAKEVASVQRTPAKEEKPKMKTLTKFMLRPEEEPSEEKTTEKPAEKISDKPKSAKPAPAKMTPSLAAKLADAKSKLTKKK